MKQVFFIMSLFICQVVVAQNDVLEIPGVVDIPCQEYGLGYGFKHSGMSNYIIRPKIEEVKRNQNGSVDIRIFLIAECREYDYFNYELRGDTLVLIYGNIEEVPDEKGESEVYPNDNFCGGCGYSFNYTIHHPKNDKNYLIAAQHTPLLNTHWQPYPIGYLVETKKSIYFTPDCKENFTHCLKYKKDETVRIYASLAEEYLILDSLVSNKFERKIIEYQTSNIRERWITFSKNLEALQSQYTKDRITDTQYEKMLNLIDSSVNLLSESLIPIMKDSRSYLHNGFFVSIEEVVEE